MNYREAYDFLISLVNIPRREYMKDPGACEVYLSRMRECLKFLGNPEKKIPHYVHITGTSGKGSVSTMIASIIAASGQKVGLLTSPHPSTILERWEINGKTISEKEFVEMVSELKKALNEFVKNSATDVPSFSELMTICAFWYFAKHKVDWAVIEVGCGGRFDATNVIPHKEAAIITNVGLDHVEILGKTKTKIAYEKSGIIKPNALVFTADTNPRVLKVIDVECQKTKTKLQRLNTKTIKTLTTSLSGSTFSYKDQTFSIPVIGAHQSHNAALAIEVTRQLGFSDKSIKAGLKKTVLPIRMEVVSESPLIIIDGAHNEDKIRSSVNTLTTLAPKKPIHLVIGFAANKDLDQMINQLAALNPKTVACTRFTANAFRKSADPRTIQTMVKKHIPKAKTSLFLDPKDALAWSRRQQQKNHLILATGSIFLSGELRTLFKS